MAAIAASTEQGRRLQQLSASGLPPSVAKFYSSDGTWRMSEPSWRYLLGQRENVRGCPSYANTLNDPGLLSSSGRMLHRRLHRKEYDDVPIEQAATGATRSPPSSSDSALANALTDRTADPAEAAAIAFFQLSHKDQKRSGFANETLCHTNGQDHNSQRWGRLGTDSPPADPNLTTLSVPVSTTATLALTLISYQPQSKSPSPFPSSFARHDDA